MMRPNEWERLTPEEMRARITHMKRSMKRMGAGLIVILLILGGVHYARRHLSTDWFLLCDLAALVTTIAIARFINPRDP